MWRKGLYIYLWISPWEFGNFHQTDPAVDVCLNTTVLNCPKHWWSSTAWHRFHFPTCAVLYQLYVPVLLIRFLERGAIVIIINTRLQPQDCRNFSDQCSELIRKLVKWSAAGGTPAQGCLLIESHACVTILHVIESMRVMIMQTLEKQKMVINGQCWMNHTLRYRIFETIRRMVLKGAVSVPDAISVFNTCMVKHTATLA